jgi:hypothetical protein
MSAIEQVPVFGLNQDAHVDSPLNFVSREEAREMKRGEQGWFINNGRAFRLAERITTPTIEDLPIRKMGSLDITASTITLRETQANVGLVDERVRNPREAVRMAQAKVRLYPRIFDTLAARAGGSWIAQVQQ